MSRKTAKGVPSYAGEDVFVLSGAEDLVPVSRSEARTRYRPRTEGLFARIERRHDAQDDYWEVRGKDGLVSTYGTPGCAGADPAAVADPADPSKVYAWKLAETRDPFDNRIVYEYQCDRGETPEHHWDQLYLKRIRYVDYGAADGDEDNGQDTFLVSVTFVYQDRPDPFSEYRPGFELRTRKRCARIEIATHAGEARLARSYEIVSSISRAASSPIC